MGVKKLGGGAAGGKAFILHLRAKTAPHEPCHPRKCERERNARAETESCASVEGTSL